MATLNIKDPEVYALADELAKRTGQTLTGAVKQAIQEKLTRQRVMSAERQRRVVDRVLERARRIAALPVLDPRSPDDIIGYSESGVPE